MCELECASFAVANLQQQWRCLIKSSESDVKHIKMWKPFHCRLPAVNHGIDLRIFPNTKHIFSLLFFFQRPLLFVFIFGRALYHTSLTCYSTATKQSRMVCVVIFRRRQRVVDWWRKSLVYVFFSSLLIITFNHVWKFYVRLKTTRR